MAEKRVVIRAPVKEPRALVFDFGGVLFDWNPRHLFRKFFAGDDEGMERFLEEIGFDGWNAAMDRGQPFPEAVQEQCARFPRYSEQIRAFDIRWEETVRGPIPGMEDLLSRLRHSGVPLFALSNTSAGKIQVLRKKYPFLGRFEKILISGEVGITKPDPRIFHLFLKRTGLQAESLIFIDDSEANVASARSLGWDAVPFVSARELEIELSGRNFL